MIKKTQPQTIDKGEKQVVSTEKFCENCQKTGLLTQSVSKFPNFKQVIAIQFSCPQCGFKSNHANFAEKQNDFGIQILFIFQHLEDTQREVVHSQNAIIHIQQIDFHITASNKPKITTIKELIARAIEQLQLKKISLTEQSKDHVETIEKSLQKVKKVLDGKSFPLTIRIRDSSGNSSIKNENHPLPDKSMQVCYFQKTVEQLMEIGFSEEQAKQEVKRVEQSKKGIKLNFNKPFQEQDFMHKQAAFFQVPCHTCLMPGQMKLCETSVPYFTDLVIMSFTCEYCGAHSVQTKCSGQVSDEAIQITLKVDGDSDLKRDLFKSQTCKVCIPEAQLELDYGTLGGQFTTVEGLLQKIHDHLGGSNPFIDSDEQFSVRMKQFLDELLRMRDGDKSFTLILIDPLSKSFLQNPFHPHEDKKARRVSRKRNEQQEDYLGFTGMNVDNYK